MSEEAAAQVEPQIQETAPDTGLPISEDGSIPFGVDELGTAQEIETKQKGKSKKVSLVPVEEPPKEETKEKSLDEKAEAVSRSALDVFEDIMKDDAPEDVKTRLDDDLDELPEEVKEGSRAERHFRRLRSRAQDAEKQYGELRNQIENREGEWRQFENNAKQAISELQAQNARLEGLLQGKTSSNQSEEIDHNDPKHQLSRELGLHKLPKEMEGIVEKVARPLQQRIDHLEKTLSQRDMRAEKAAIVQRMTSEARNAANNVFLKGIEDDQVRERLGRRAEALIMAAAHGYRSDAGLAAKAVRNLMLETARALVESKGKNGRMAVSAPSESTPRPIAATQSGSQAKGLSMPSEDQLEQSGFKDPLDWAFNRARVG